jgi:transposase-like protein
VAYPMEFRLAVAASYDEHGSSIEVAELFGCSESWVRRLIQRREAGGSLEPLTPKRPDTRKLDDDDLAQQSPPTTPGRSSDIADMPLWSGEKRSSCGKSEIRSPKSESNPKH